MTNTLTFHIAPAPFTFQRSAFGTDLTYLISKHSGGYRVTVSKILRAVGLELQGDMVRSVDLDMLRDALTYCRAFESNGYDHLKAIEAVYANG